jgi:hypothetical protein
VENNRRELSVVPGDPMTINVSARLLLHPDLQPTSSLREGRPPEASSAPQAKQSQSDLKAWEASLARTCSVPDKPFDFNFGPSVSNDDEIKPQREYGIFFAVYLIAIAVAQIGWLWLIARIAIYVIRRFLQ